jgi:Zn-dependent protease with chaperone function
MQASSFRRSVRAVVGTLAAVVLAGALGACATHERDDDADAPATPAAPGPGARRGGDEPATTCAWIPADAAEVTKVASLHSERDDDPMCNQPASTLDVPKAVAVQIEREIRESTKMSDEEEARIGARLEAALPREPSLAGKLDLPEDVRRYKGYVRDIVKNLASKSSRPDIRYRIHTVHSPVFNAAAMPGGVLLVFTGLFEGREAVRSEAELAGVLGHELTHVERRHVVAAYQFARAALGDTSDEAVLAMRMITQPLSTEHELEADDRGMELMTLAGYDPQAVVDLWRRHARTEATGEPGDGRRGRRGARRGGRRGGGERDVIAEVMSGVEELLRSHPPATVRACHAMAKLEWAREHAPCDRLYDGRTNVTTRVAGTRRAY